MGPNGQAQYFARDLSEACQILLRYYEHSWVAPGERFPRRAPTQDPRDRDVRAFPHGGGFRTVGEVFSPAANPGRKKPFEIRRVMEAVSDQDHPPLERWYGMRDAEIAVVWDVHLGGHPVCLLGFESKPLPRLGWVPVYGPDQWTGGTLFPQASKKVARGGRGIRPDPQRAARPAGRLGPPHHRAGAAAPVPDRGGRARHGTGAGGRRPPRPRPHRRAVKAVPAGWLTVDASEVPENDGWLTPAERVRLATLELPWRRADWRLGRWAAKHAVAAFLGASFEAVEIRPAADGAPEALLGGDPAPVSLSFSHRAGRAACAVAPAGTALGCDLELVEPRSAAFVRDYLTPAEQALVEAAPEMDHPFLVNLIWSAKESALKALRTGLRLDTRSVE